MPDCGHRHAHDGTAPMAVCDFCREDMHPDKLEIMIPTGAVAESARVFVEFHKGKDDSFFRACGNCKTERAEEIRAILNAPMELGTTSSGANLAKKMLQDGADYANVAKAVREKSHANLGLYYCRIMSHCESVKLGKGYEIGYTRRSLEKDAEKR